MEARLQPSRRETILVATGITKRYGGVSALDDSGFELKKGEVLGLCGENGAGKSTLIKVLGGIVTPEQGSLSIDGQMVEFGQRPDPSLLSIVHQELSIIPHLSVLDNLLIGSEITRRGLYLRRRLRSEAQRLLALVGLNHVDPDGSAGQLSLAEQQLVEIARGIASQARVLLLDEPTATLSDAEIAKVFAVLRSLRDGGASIVIVSHRLTEIFELTDRVTVFRNGRHVLTCPTADLDGPALVRAMIGHDVERTARAIRVASEEAEPPKIAARGLTVAGGFGPVDFTVKSGEIVAIVGQLGSGANAYLEAFAGLRESTGGALELDGRPVRLAHIGDAYRKGIAYVAEDRAIRGVFLDASIETNMTCQILGEISPMGLVSSRLSHERADALAKTFTVDARRLRDRVSTLSGGNQQKVALAKAAAARPSLLLLNEPTRGVDIGARSEIYARLRSMADDGLTVLFYSTDLEEVMELADRVITVYRGRVVRSLTREATAPDEVLKDILHGFQEQLA